MTETETQTPPAPKVAPTKRTLKFPEAPEPELVTFNVFLLGIMPEGALTPLPPVRVFSNETFSELLTRVNSKKGSLVHFPKSLDLQLDLDEDQPSDTIPYCCYRANTIYSIAVEIDDEEDDDDEEDGDDEEEEGKTPPTDAQLLAPLDGPQPRPWAPPSGVVPEGFGVRQ